MLTRTMNGDNCFFPFLHLISIPPLYKERREFAKILFFFHFSNIYYIKKFLFVSSVCSISSSNLPHWQNMEVASGKGDSSG